MLNFYSVLKYSFGFLFVLEGDGMSALDMPLYLVVIWFAQFFFLKIEMNPLEYDLL